MRLGDLDSWVECQCSMSRHIAQLQSIGLTRHQSHATGGNIETSWGRSLPPRPFPCGRNQSEARPPVGLRIETQPLSESAVASMFAKSPNLTLSRRVALNHSTKRPRRHLRRLLPPSWHGSLRKVGLSNRRSAPDPTAPRPTESGSNPNTSNASPAGTTRTSGRGPRRPGCVRRAPPDCAGAPSRW